MGPELGRYLEDLPQVAVMVKDPPANAGDIRDMGSIPEVGRFPWRKAWQPTVVFLPGESHGQRRLVGYSPWCAKESDMTEQLSIYTVIED